MSAPRLTREQLRGKAEQLMEKDPALGKLLEADLADPGSPRVNPQELDRIGRRASSSNIGKDVDAVRTYCQLLALAQHPAERQSLREAKVFQLAWPDALELMDDIGVYVIETGMRGGDYLKRVWDASAPMPFPTVFLGVQRPLPFEQMTPEGKTYGNALPLGWLCTKDTVRFYALSIESGIVKTADFARFPDGRVRYPGDDAVPGAEAAIGAMPFMVWTLVSQEANVTRETGVNPIRRRQMRRDFQLSDAPPLPIPRDYRVIDVKGSVRWVSARRKAITACGPSWRLLHRIDVRAHWWIRVRRDFGPIPADLVERLDPKYQWFDDTSPPLDDETAILLQKRAISPRKPGEWMAILKRRVDDYERGPEDGPYVPAVWRVRVDEDPLPPGTR